MPFNVGDMAVYPVQGVTEILGIETIEIAGTKSRFYVLRRLDSDDTIRVPVANVKRVGLRSLVTADEIEDVMTVLTADKIAIEEPIGTDDIAGTLRRSKVVVSRMLPRYCETCTSLALTNSFHTGSAECTKWRWTSSFRNFRWRRKRSGHRPRGSGASARIGDWALLLSGQVCYRPFFIFFETLALPSVEPSLS